MLRAMSEPAPRRSAAPCIRLGAAGLLLGAFSAIAAPEASEDALQRLLADKGLLAPAPVAGPTNQGGLARKMRDGASEMVRTAMNFLGVPYRRGGSDESGFDCSGFTRHVFELSLGLELPRRSDEQAKAAGLLPIKRGELKPGDLVFFNTLKRTFSHVGIYIGDDKFIHSPRTGAEVRVENMQLAYWNKRYNGARRAETIAAHAPATPVQGSAAAAFNHDQWGSTPQTSSR
jgi:cell wall-associated NlpC family hydrolase